MKNIFVIDPSIMIHKIIELTFKDNSEYRVKFFSNYPLKVDENEKAEYVFITIDLSGVEIEEAIKDLKTKYNCPVIAMVPKFLDYNRDAIINAGADAILEKPFTSDELKNALVSLSESTALKEETIAEIDSETFEDIGSFDEDLTLSEADLMDVDKEILEQEVSGEELMLDDDIEEDDIDTKELRNEMEDVEDVHFDEEEFEKELEAELGDDIDAELEDELEDVDFSEEELEKDLESMDISSIEEDAEEFLEEEAESSTVATNEYISEAPTQRISQEEIAGLREMAEEMEEAGHKEEIQDEQFGVEETTLDLDKETEQGDEFEAEEDLEKFEDVFEEEVEEGSDLEHTVRTEDIKVEEEFEGDAQEPEFIEKDEFAEGEIEQEFAAEGEEGALGNDFIVKEAKDLDKVYEEESKQDIEIDHHVQSDELKIEEHKGEKADDDVESKEGAVASEEEMVFQESHPTEFDESDIIESEKKKLFHDAQSILSQEETSRNDSVVEKVVSEDAKSAGIELSDEDVRRIAEEVIKKLSDRIIREIAWEVIPQIAEDVVLRRIKELEKEIE